MHQPIYSQNHTRQLNFLKTLCLLLFTVLISGCSYYKVFTRSNPNPEIVGSIILEGQESAWVNKTYVLHLGDNVFILKNPRVEGEYLAGDTLLRYYMTEHAWDYGFPDPNERKNRLKPSKGESRILKEVHLYIPADKLDIPIEDLIEGPVKYYAEIKDIVRIDTYEPDVLSNTTSLFWGGLGVFVLSIFGTGTVLLFMLF